MATNDTYASIVEDILDATRCPRQADCARRIGTLRGVTLRGVNRALGLYVSRGDAFDRAARVRMLAQPLIRAAIARALGVEVESLPEPLTE